jgi:FSR family fosmidomycin resistance protein-like MFS transporter
METEASKANLRVMAALTLVHFTGDFYSSFTSPLLPVFAETLGLSLTQVGIVAGLNRFLAFIVQPPVGYLADRSQSRLYVLGGMLLTVVCLPLTGLVGSFEMLLAFVALGSLGSSMFHPAVAGMVPVYSGSQVGLGMSIFNTGGTLAFAVGPVLVTWVVTHFGLRALPATMVLGLTAAAWLFMVLPAPVNEGLRRLGFLGALRESLGPVWRSVVLIWLVMVLRAVTGQAFLTFMPVLLVREGHSLVAAGALYALFTFAGTLSGIASGHLSDRFGCKPIFFVAHALMAPALLALLALPGSWVYPGAALAGAVVMATLPLGVVMAQRLAPRGRSMVSSLMMGLAYGLGGALTPLVGWLADHYSIRTVLASVALIPVASLILISLFPAISSEAPVTEKPAVAG